MSISTDMSAPVTRGELREELERALAPLATKVELEIWGGALLARIQLGEQQLRARIESGEQRLVARIEASEQRMVAELARHTRASQESMSAQFSAIDDKYADLPPRVSRLEATVLPPKRR